MKNLILIFSLLLSFLGYAQEGDDNFVVVELFTSQGCSSCPPADRVLSEIIQQHKEKEVYALSFHVTYWDYIGWKDPYGQEQFSQRQRQYGRAFASNRIYTPQMIVNGSSEFVGSKKDVANSEINKHLGETPNQHLNIKASKKGNQVVIDYTHSANSSNSITNFALVESGLQNSVIRGENRNRTLHHDNVVRVFKTIPTKKSGSITLDLPSEIDLSKVSPIAYTQDSNTMKVQAAKTVRL